MRILVAGGAGFKGRGLLEAEKLSFENGLTLPTNKFGDFLAWDFIKNYWKFWLVRRVRVR